MGLKEQNIQLSYAGKGDAILRDFLLPAISQAIKYDRVTSFFKVESLLAISQGIDSLFKRKGKMRLIIGIHSFPPELIDAMIRREYLKDQISKIRTELQEGISSISDELQKKRLATLAWMINDGLLEVKAASVKGSGIFHPKTIILSDDNGDKIAAVGSPNETSSGLGGNFEQIMVATSWLIPDAVNIQEQFFDSLWNNQQEDAEVIDVSEDTAVTILSALGNEYQNPNSISNSSHNGIKLIEQSSKMIANFFVSGDIPALYVHQERAVLEALSRWPVRVLFSDEVGLGKTFEVAATMAFMIKYCGLNRVMILTPKSVLKQWQDELSEHFNINAWLYDSSSRTYYDTHGKSKRISMGSPIKKATPDIILMSAQFARGSGANGNVFSYSDSVLPELLIVDEAHSARVSRSISGSTQSTRIYQMLESVSRKIPHLILATATPMQKDAEEYHAILKLLGLPSAWRKPRNYQTSLRLIACQDIPDTSDASNAATLLLKTITEMNPDFSRLDATEADIVKNILKMKGNTDQYELGSFVQQHWDSFHSAFIKLHPAHLLTVRNTRRSLSQVGYKFPKRNLFEESIDDSMKIQLFYNKVDQYLTEECFSVEQELYPDRKISLGFIRVSYRQRVASSLYSCKESLNRRYERITALKKSIDCGEALANDDFKLISYLDAVDSDDLLRQDVDEESSETDTNIDIRALKRAIGIELTALSSLVQEANHLLSNKGDLKIVRSIQLAMNCLNNDDSVLLFSRYTDTIDALLMEFKKNGAATTNAYGVYTGQKSVIVHHNRETYCDKTELKKALFARSIRIVFCSDAASEGLNLQAARVLINVDVPWTPARLEQRIGRVARLGQIAEEVDIYNVWYPYSIEARMYHRIQKRLEGTNLAIGEFPEIVASSIKAAILDNKDEDSAGLEQLNEIRNSYQLSALEALWNRFEGETESSVIRNRLMEICAKEFPITGTTLNGSIVSFQMPDGTAVELTATNGMAESISLQSIPWKFFDYSDERISIVRDAEDNPVCFAMNLAGSERPITYESVFSLILGEDLSPVRLLTHRPKMVPNSQCLNLMFAIDSELPSPPLYWIELEKEV